MDKEDRTEHQKTKDYPEGKKSGNTHRIVRTLEFRCNVVNVFDLQSICHDKNEQAERLCYVKAPSDDIDELRAREVVKSQGVKSLIPICLFNQPQGN